MGSNAIQSVIGALIVGLLTIFAIVIGQGVVSGQKTTGWPAILTTIFPNVIPVVGVVGIIAMFVIVIQVASHVGEGGV